MSRKVLFQLVLPLIGLSILFWLLAFAPGERKNQPTETAQFPPCEGAWSRQRRI